MLQSFTNPDWLMLAVHLKIKLWYEINCVKEYPTVFFKITDIVSLCLNVQLSVSTRGYSWSGLKQAFYFGSSQLLPLPQGNRSCAEKVCSL